MRINLSFTLIFIFIVFTACSRVPFSNRKQFRLLPEKSVIQLSLTTYSDFIKTHKLSSDQANTQLVKKVGKKITKAVEELLKEENKLELIKDYKWEFNLVEENTPNAWCLPGGKIVVYTGILPYTKDENGLAVVLGHEVAHAIARHGNERLSQQLLYQLGATSLAVAIKDKPDETKKSFMIAFAIAGQVGILLPYSRLHEKEADKLGLIFMAKAGYNPKHAVEFWEEMSKIKSNTPVFLRTHPTSKKRIKIIKKFLPEAMKYYKPNNYE